MEMETIDNLIALRLSNQINEEQNTILNEWLNQSDENKKYFHDVERVWNLTDIDSTFNPDVNAAWNKIKAELKLSQEAKVVSINKPGFKLYRVAAAVVVLLGLGIFLYNSVKSPEMVQYATNENETKELTLPDNSKVILNANSSISYPEKFDGDVRNVELKGEAFFEVTKNKEKPFIINTYDTYTKVLGTSFNVKALSENENVTVSVATGKVEVGFLSNDLKVQLTPGNTAIIDVKNIGIQKVENSVENITAWKTGVLTFDDQLLSVLINDIELLYNVNIEADSKILDCHFTGTFNKPELTEILNVLELSNGITHSEKDGIIYLNGKSCL